MSIDGVRAEIEARIALGDADPETGHGNIDALLECVLRDIAKGHPDGIRMAMACVELLEYETKADWRRWYA